MLAKDVRALAEDPLAPAELREFAAGLAGRYRYPVDFQIVDVTGRMISQGEANAMREPYRRTLERGLE